MALQATEADGKKLSRFTWRQQFFVLCLHRGISSWCAGNL
jgi:hypothetical protein